MVKIMFVCHGNICRSPMAEFVFRDLAERRGLSDRFCVLSAATSAEELGNPVHPGAAGQLRLHGISPAGKRAVRLKPDDYRLYDAFVVMDHNNLQNIRRIFREDPDGKISLLLDHTDRGGEVADPWYTGDFETAYRDIAAGCEGLLTELIKKYPERRSGREEDL